MPVLLLRVRLRPAFGVGAVRSLLVRTLLVRTAFVRALLVRTLWRRPSRLRMSVRCMLARALRPAAVGCGDRDADQLLDVAQERPLLSVAKRDRHAIGAGAR